jgi:hypothetical protein
MGAQNAAHYILIDLNAEGQCDLLSNSPECGGNEEEWMVWERLHNGRRVRDVNSG